MAKTDDEIQWALGYSNAVFLALKTYLETLSSRKRKRYISNFKVNCQQLRKLLHRQHPDPEQMLRGFDFAAEGLTKTDKEWQTFFEEGLRKLLPPE